MMNLILRRLIVILLLMSSVRSSYAQTHDMDFVIEIDDNLAIGSIAKPRIIINNDEVIEIEYHPGNLSLKQSDYKKLRDVGTDSAMLAFDYYEYQGKKQILYNYELPFSNRWFDATYVIMKIYNLNKKEYKGVFEPLDKDRNYTFELHSSEGSMLRVRKKVKKRKCK